MCTDVPVCRADARPAGCRSRAARALTVAAVSARGDVVVIEPASPTRPGRRPALLRAAAARRSERPPRRPERRRPARCTPPAGSPSRRSTRSTRWPASITPATRIETGDYLEPLRRTTLPGRRWPTGRRRTSPTRASVLFGADRRALRRRRPDRRSTAAPTHGVTAGARLCDLSRPARRPAARRRWRSAWWRERHGRADVRSCRRSRAQWRTSTVTDVAVPRRLAALADLLLPRRLRGFEVGDLRPRLFIARLEALVVVDAPRPAPWPARPTAPPGRAISSSGTRSQPRISSRIATTCEAIFSLPSRDAGIVRPRE